MKEATVSLFWTPSPSPDVVKRKVIVTVDGSETVIDGTGLSEVRIKIAANKSGSFKTVVVDSEGNDTTTGIYDFVMGDLEAPLPDTDLGHKVIEVHDVDEA